MNPIHANRETWLTASLSHIRTHFTARGFNVPEKIRVSPGWPHTGGALNLNQAAQTFEIFMSPKFANPTGEEGILAVLVHEVAHTVAGIEAGHKAPFKRVALGVGLEGKMTSTVAGAELLSIIEGWATTLGEYPHAAMDPNAKNGRKKQSTRMIKCECPACGYVVRTARKWLEIGPPKCPTHGDLIHEPIEEDGGGE